VELSVVRLTRVGASDTKRHPRVSWFIWQGAQPLPLAQVRPTYRCRFGIEHGYRLQKQRLLWNEPRLRSPEQFERWTQIVAIAHNHLVLARPLVQAIRQQMASANSLQRPPSRCVEAWPSFWPPWAHPPGRPNPAENRRDEPRGHT
jgi:hypothetical protein